MSSQSLLSMLSQGQSTRARSQAHRHGLSPTFSFMPRSASTSLHKQQISQTSNAERSPQLYKIVHLLNVKVRQSYFYSFCRIEQIAKSKQIASPNTSSGTQALQQIPQKVHTSNIATKGEHSLGRIREGIEKLVDFEKTLASKIQIRCQEEFAHNCFRSIKLRSSHIGLSIKMDKVVADVVRSYKREFLGTLKAIEKDKIRGQIAIDSISCLLSKFLAEPFSRLRNCRPQIPSQITDLYNGSKISFKKITEQSQYSFTQQEQPPIQDRVSEAHIIARTLSECQPLNKTKKIKLKDKKVAPAKSIAFPSGKFSKSGAKTVRLDNPIAKDELIQQEEESTRQFLTLKPDIFVNCLTDFSDNCNLFQQPSLTLYSQTSARTTTFEEFVSEEKQSEEFLPTDDCNTQRTGKQAPEIQQRTGCKYKSMGNIVPRQLIDMNNCSPLLKVQQLMSNMNAYRSAEKQTKTLNVNLPRNFYESRVPCSTFSKTPSKEKRHDQTVFRSDNKENMVQRLITERSKQLCEKGGLQSGISGNKHKSTVLVRDRRTKIEKKEMFTARKMKIEIENIINRRNKQLAARTEVRPIK